LNRQIKGCVFAYRCAAVTSLCRDIAPALEMKLERHAVACHYATRQVEPA
jgi:peptide/nickel transport system ATP-binding protein